MTDWFKESERQWSILKSKSDSIQNEYREALSWLADERIYQDGEASDTEVKQNLKDAVARWVLLNRKHGLNLKWEYFQ